MWVGDATMNPKPVTSCSPNTRLAHTPAMKKANTALVVWLALTIGATAGSTLAQSTFIVQVTKVGEGAGLVVSTPPGINCSTTCQAPFPSGTVVTLNVSGGTSSPQWHGDCEGATCTLTVSKYSHAILASAPQSQPFTVLRGFLPGGRDARQPGYSEPVTDGTYFYGMTLHGGLLDQGAIYRMRGDGSEYTLLHSFSGGRDDGSSPYGSLTLVGSVLFGLTQKGGLEGNGVIFRQNCDGSDFSLLHSFTGGIDDGGTPYGSLTLSGSVLFGMTHDGGATGSGTIFKINIDGTLFQVIHSFSAQPNDGSMPKGTLTAAGNVLYGMTCEGGASGWGGTIFKVNSDGTDFGLLHSFAVSTDDGFNPTGSLTLSGNVLYGMTTDGGAMGSGMVFKISTNGSDFAPLYSFGQDNGEMGRPFGSLTLAADVLYGMSCDGGTQGNGSLFRLDTDGSDYATLHDFTGGATDGGNPQGSLLMVGSVVYGMASSGGSNGYGTVFSFSTSGSSFSLLHTFAPGVGNGSSPYGSLTMSGSVLYGMTNAGGAKGCGTIFKVNTDGSDFALLHAFAGGLYDGCRPYGSLTWSDGVLYGVTKDGGSHNDGTIFSLKTDGTLFTLMHSFAGGDVDGSHPYGSLTLSEGVLYGMTNEGGIGISIGTVFKININGSGYAILHSFDPEADGGMMPFGALTLSGNSLFGMTNDGGINQSRGVIFKVNTDGSDFEVLHGFGSIPHDGETPFGSLTLSASLLYGMTTMGGSGGVGTIFQINTDGTGYSPLYSFAEEGNAPYGSLVLSGEKLLGLTLGGGTHGRGTVFQFNTEDHSYQTLHSMTGGVQGGESPYYDSPVVAGNTLFGMTKGGGIAGGGTVFSFLLPRVIYGTVTYGGVGLSNVSLMGLPGDPSTKNDGSYSAVVDVGWSGVVTPVSPGYMFTPLHRTYEDVNEDQPSQNYVAEDAVFTITPSAGPHGSISPSTPQVLGFCGSTSFTITPDVGYIISDVQIDDTSIGIVTNYSFSCVDASHTISVVFAPIPPSAFYTLTPCRVFDTRDVNGPSVGIPIAANQSRMFTVKNICGIPATAKAIVTNVTVVNGSAVGSLSVIAGHLTSTATTTIEIPLARARANNALIGLAVDGAGTILAINTSPGTVHLILDVNGYFQ